MSLINSLLSELPKDSSAYVLQFEMFLAKFAFCLLDGARLLVHGENFKSQEYGGVGIDFPFSIQLIFYPF